MLLVLIACSCVTSINPSSANFTKWSNTVKQLVSNLPTNCLRVFGHFVGLVIKGLMLQSFFSSTLFLAILIDLHLLYLLFA